MSQKRPAFTSLSNLVAKKEKIDSDTATERNHPTQPLNPFLARPVNPEEAIRIFLIQSRNTALKSKSSQTDTSRNTVIEIEGRLGIIKTQTGGGGDARVLSSGPKRVNIQGKPVVATAFLCSSIDNDDGSLRQRSAFEAGINRSHYLQWTSGGLSEISPISTAFGVRVDNGSSESATIKRDLVETEKVETVYTGYSGNYRVSFPGDRTRRSIEEKKTPSLGKMESKVKLTCTDVALPSSPYDLRLTLATEETLDNQIHDPPTGCDLIRLKKRRSYTRRDNSFAWILDVTEVTKSHDHAKQTSVEYEVEFELNHLTTSKLLNERDESKIQSLCSDLSRQLWWMVSQINPNTDVLNVEDFLREHPNPTAVRSALAQCQAIKAFLETKQWSSAISSSSSSSLQTNVHISKLNFPGCMPVNFSRHHVDEIQQSDENAYFLSEKTDGVRHFMIFTGETVVLIDRTMKGKQPVPLSSDLDETVDPMHALIQSVKKGAVLDGEVVMHRKFRRPVFIVFDVLCISADQPVLHLSFEQRLNHLMKASFCLESALSQIFSESEVVHPTTALPLVRKNFVKRTQLNRLFDHIHEEKGSRYYRDGNTHNHQTDGIIFQPNTPYVSSTDNKLLKWKYLDTVTIDVQLLGQLYQNDNNKLRVGVLGDEGTIIEMTRFIKLPFSDLLRLEADRNEVNGGNIIEVGFDPTVGEWYYRTIRSDKTTPNHISTVLGTLLEVSEGLSTEELRYRMSIPPNCRDTFRRDFKRMQRQLLEHQHDQLKQSSQIGKHSNRS